MEAIKKIVSLTFFQKRDGGVMWKTKFQGTFFAVHFWTFSGRGVWAMTPCKLNELHH